MPPRFRTLVLCTSMAMSVCAAPAGLAEARPSGPEAAVPSAQALVASAADETVVSPVPLSPNDLERIASRRVTSAATLGPKLGPLPRQKWDSCSLFDSRYHKVTYFGSGVNLLCGPPGGSGWGYRHIKERHMSDFQYYASFDRLNWEDIMYWAAWYAINRPQAKKSNSRTQKACRSYQLLFYNIPRRQLVATQVFRTIYMWNKPQGSQPPSGTVITVTPYKGQHCDAGAVA